MNDTDTTPSDSNRTPEHPTEDRGSELGGAPGSASSPPYYDKLMQTLKKVRRGAPYWKEAYRLEREENKRLKRYIKELQSTINDYEEQWVDEHV